MLLLQQNACPPPTTLCQPSLHDSFNGSPINRKSIIENGLWNHRVRPLTYVLGLVGEKTGTETRSTLNPSVANVAAVVVSTPCSYLPWPLIGRLRPSRTIATSFRHQHVSNKQQWLPWDEKLIIPVGVDEGRPAVLPKVVGTGM